MSQIELVKLIQHYGFNTRSYDDRLPLFMENCEFVPDLGVQLCSFNRMGYIAVFSQPEASTNHRIFEVALRKAFEEFKTIDTQPSLAVNEQQIVMYRAYLSSVHVLTITRHIVNAGSRWYLLYKKIAQLSKSQGKSTNELVLSKIEIT